MDTSREPLRKLLIGSQSKQPQAKPQRHGVPLRAGPNGGVVVDLHKLDELLKIRGNGANASEMTLSNKIKMALQKNPD